MTLTFASYNIHKAVGLDRRRDPDRILAILREMDADVIALQEADRRFGRRISALPLASILEHTPYAPVPLSMRPDSLGWHGNAILVRKGIEIVDAAPVPLPTLEPRGAIRADLAHRGRRFRVVGMHLDLSGLRRRHQIRTVLAHINECDGELPSVLMGDLNEWARRGGSLREFDSSWSVVSSGYSFPSRRPVAQLDRIVLSPQWSLAETGVFRSALAARGSDHLPVWARVDLPK